MKGIIVAGSGHRDQENDKVRFSGSLLMAVLVVVVLKNAKR